VPTALRAACIAAVEQRANQGWGSGSNQHESKPLTVTDVQTRPHSYDRNIESTRETRDFVSPHMFTQVGGHDILRYLQSALVNISFSCIK